MKKMEEEMAAKVNKRVDLYSASLRSSLSLSLLICCLLPMF